MQPTGHLKGPTAVYWTLEMNLRSMTGEQQTKALCSTRGLGSAAARPRQQVARRPGSRSRKIQAKVQAVQWHDPGSRGHARSRLRFRQRTEAAALLAALGMSAMRHAVHTHPPSPNIHSQSVLCSPRIVQRL